MKYRKKPIEVEAFLYKVGNVVPLWAQSAGINEFRTLKNNSWVEIHTKEGVMIALPGDYIIKGIEGEIYPCKASVFEATYEKVEE